MAAENRQAALKDLIKLAEAQGYATRDDIIECADKYSLSIADFDWLSSSITRLGTIVYEKKPEQAFRDADAEFDDYERSDYDAVYERIVELNPSLRHFVSCVKAIIPPQRGEVKRLKHQAADGNKHARERMIQMFLRVALREALKRAESYDMDIEEAIELACLGLIKAVDHYNPDSSSSFQSYATLWIFRTFSQEQQTLRPLIYLPYCKMQQSYVAVYPLLKEKGCIGCGKLGSCRKAVDVVRIKLNCKEELAQNIILQMTPFERYEDLRLLESNDAESIEEQVLFRLLQEEIDHVLATLPDREQEVLRMRFGLDDGYQLTLDDVAFAFDVTRERIRQIEAKALRRLRHPKRSRRLKRFLD